jgi:hypothetical protein
MPQSEIAFFHSTHAKGREIVVESSDADDDGKHVKLLDERFSI